MENKLDRAIASVKAVIGKIKDLNTREACERFYDERVLSKSVATIANKALGYRKAFSRFETVSLESITIEQMCTLLLIKDNAAGVTYLAFSFFYKNELCKIFRDNRRKFMFFKNITDYSFLEKVYENKEILNRTIYASGVINGEVAYIKVIVTRSDAYISSVITDFLISRNASMDYDFPERMASYLSINNVQNVFDSLNDNFIGNYFEENIGMGRGANMFSIYFLIWLLNQIPVNEQQEKCPLYNIQILGKEQFSTFFKSGHRPVKYNKFDKIPKIDNWMLIPNVEEITKSTRIMSSSVISVSFGQIKNKWFREYAKQHFWYGQSNINTKRNENYRIVKFINTYFPDKNKKYSSLDGTFCANYKSYVMSAFKSTETRNNLIYPILYFVKFLDKNKLINVDSNCYLFLDNKGSLNISGAKGVRNDDLKLIVDYLNAHKYESNNDLMFYVILNICLNTGFRISQVVGLKIDCVQESMKKNEYLIKCATKVSGGESVEQPCARILKTIIDEYLRTTAEFRESIPTKELKEQLFVTKNNFKNVYGDFTSTTFSNHFKKVCAKIGIDIVNAKNLRSTFYTNAKELTLINNLSDATLLGITGHSNVNTVNNHYIQEQIRDALQATNNIIIGNVDVNGKITKNKEEINTSKENSVEDECGYCQSEFCDLNGPLSCLLCPHFATTIDRIPFFERHIKNFDKLIHTSETRHDVEDYVNLKRLFAKYLEELLKIKEANRDGERYS